MERQVSKLKAEVTRQRKLIEELNGLQTLYGEATSASPLGILAHDAEGKILIFNSRLEQLTGYTASDIPDIPTWFRLIYPNENYRKAVLAEPRDEDLPEATRVRESMITCLDGRTCLCRFTSVCQESGLRFVFIQSVEDSDTIGTEQDGNDHGYRFLLQQSPVLTLLWIQQADDFVLVSYNAAAKRLLGNKLELSLGRTPGDIFSSRKEFYEYLQRCLTDKKPLKSEFRTSPGDRDSYKHLRLTFIYTAPALVTVHLEDLTRLKQAEEKISRKEKRFQELVNLLPETVYEMDPSGRILFLNRNGYERFGVSPEDIEKGFYGSSD